MILLDTHVWIKWTGGVPDLSAAIRRFLVRSVDTGTELGVSVVSCWELALLVERGRLDLGRPPLEWIEIALARPSVRLVELTPRIAVASTQLPGEFHRDPGDRLLVATARELGCELLTGDDKILAYSGVKTIQFAP